MQICGPTAAGEKAFLQRPCHEEGPQKHAVGLGHDPFDKSGLRCARL